MHKHWIKRAAVAVALIATTVVVTPSTASAGVYPESNCGQVWSSWDPDEGAGAGYSYCVTPYKVREHRMRLFCYYGGDAYGAWVRPWQQSHVTCVDGSGAFLGYVETR